MFAVIILTVVLSPVALAEESPEEASLDLPADPDLPASLDGVAGHPLADVDHEVITDISAYTVHQGQWRLGLVNQDVGLLEHLSVGTTAALWAFSVPNGHAKLTVLDTARLDLAVKGGLYQADLSRTLDMPGGSARTVPLGATASLRLTPRGTVHGGLDLYRLHMEGSMGASDIADTLALLSGTDFDTSLLDVLGDGADVFASADMTMTRARLAYDHRLGPKDSLLLTLNHALGLRGSVTAGSSVEVAGQTLEVGGSTDVAVPIPSSLSTVVAVGWQHSGRRIRTRVGIPLTTQPNMLLGLGSVFQLEWVLGPVSGGDRAEFQAAFPAST